METLLRTIERIIPKKLYKAGQPTYHWLLAQTGAFLYRYPSKDLKVIGVTGTKGKTTTTELIASVLKTTGEKVALANSIHFVIDTEDKRNMYKMSMPGRFFMQKFLHEAKKAGCTYVVLEMTSEGAKQFRHKGIYLDALVFTNLAPEHIESHGSFENYKAAKISLMETLAPKKTKKETYFVPNVDDEEVDAFLAQPVSHTVPFSDKDITHTKSDNGHLTIQVGKTTLYTKLHGTFNAKNVLAAITVGRIFGLTDDQIKEGIEAVEKIPGRAEQIIGDPYEVYVDYAHTPDSLIALYSSFPNQHKVCVLGNTGGGRDTWKRPEMARIADKYCDQVILTDEDPYDEDPQAIIEDMRPSIADHKLTVIMDRRKAINFAMKSAPENGVVLITGKGTDPYIMRADGEKEPWSDADVVREEFEKLQ